MFENMFENRKSSKIRKKVDNGLLPRKNGRQRCFMPELLTVCGLLEPGWGWLLFGKEVSLNGLYDCW